jgi:hypothetical protein
MAQRHSSNASARQSTVTSRGAPTARGLTDRIVMRDLRAIDLTVLAFLAVINRRDSVLGALVRSSGAQ